jgi:hypothetical protein
VLGGQAVAIATWWALNRLTLDQLQAEPRLFVPFLLTLGLAVATKRGSIGRAIVEAEPERAPRLQRRFWLALLVTFAGVLVAFGGLAL